MHFCMSINMNSDKCSHGAISAVCITFDDVSSRLLAIRVPLNVCSIEVIWSVYCSQNQSVDEFER